MFTFKWLIYFLIFINLSSCSSFQKGSELSRKIATTNGKWQVSTSYIYNNFIDENGHFLFDTFIKKQENINYLEDAILNLGSLEWSNLSLVERKTILINAHNLFMINLVVNSLKENSQYQSIKNDIYNPRSRFLPNTNSYINVGGINIRVYGITELLLGKENLTRNNFKDLSKSSSRDSGIQMVLGDYKREDFFDKRIIFSLSMPTKSGPHFYRTIITKSNIEDILNENIKKFLDIDGNIIINHEKKHIYINRNFKFFRHIIGDIKQFLAEYKKEIDQKVFSYQFKYNKYNWNLYRE